MPRTLPRNISGAGREQIFPERHILGVLVYGISRVIILHNVCHFDEGGKPHKTHQLAPQLKKALIAVVESALTALHDSDAELSVFARAYGIGQKFSHFHRHALGHIPAHIGDAVAVEINDLTYQVSVCHNSFHRKIRRELG